MSRALTAAVPHLSTDFRNKNIMHRLSKYQEVCQLLWRVGSLPLVFKAPGIENAVRIMSITPLTNMRGEFVVAQSLSQLLRVPLVQKILFVS